MEYLASSVRQLRKLDPQLRNRVVRYMREHVSSSSDAYRSGHALEGVWSGFWRYRVGDIRVICGIEDSKLRVVVVKVGHRGAVYERGPTAQMLAWSKPQSTDGKEPE